MTKKIVKKKAKEETQIAEAGAFDYGEMSGFGTDDIDANDVNIPILRIIQSSSPERKKSKDKYIPGAEEGNVANAAVGELVKLPMEFVIIARERAFSEYYPHDSEVKPGEYVGTHKPSDAKILELQAAQGRGGLKTAEGTEINETFALTVMLLGEDGLPTTAGTMMCSKTKIKPYKKLMSRINAIAGKLKREGKGVPPLFAFRLLADTVAESNDQYEWHNWNFTAAVNDDLRESMISPRTEAGAIVLRECFEWSKLIASGEKQVDYETEAAGSNADAKGAEFTDEEDDSFS